MNHGITQNNVTGVIDWEYAGWYPEYWEYAQIMRLVVWGDWSVWMDKTAPQRWVLPKEQRKGYVGCMVARRNGLNDSTSVLCTIDNEIPIYTNEGAFLAATVQDI